MAQAIGSPKRTNRKSLVPRSLERRLFIAYFAIFVALLVAFALAIHLSFQAGLQRQTASHLETLASAGVRSVDFDGDLPFIDRTISSTKLLAREEGLQWFDSRDKLIDEEGLVPDDKSLSMSGGARYAAGREPLEIAVRAIVHTSTGRISGWVRASKSDEEARNDVRQLDIVLAAGIFLALAASAGAGRYLQRETVQPIRASYETLRAFTADASHELRGPLTAISSNADAALRDTNGMRGRDRERFESILHATKQMRGLTDDLLLLAHADRSLERELFVVNVDELIDKLLLLYQTQFKTKDVALSARGKRELQVFGNPDQIERILANLIQNALRYTLPGGSVEIKTELTKAHVVVTVTDTGIGIAPQHLEKIFERFWRAEDSRSPAGGTGLGLPIARALARRHGGDIAVMSRLGKGSSFTVTFPTRPPLVK